MNRTLRNTGLLTATALALGATLAAPSRAGAITQPNGQTIPSALGCSGGQPSGLAAVFACTCLEPNTCNVGAPCPTATTCEDGSKGTCETTLWHGFGDNVCIPSNQSGLDPIAAASLSPQTFWPSGPLSFTLLSRGSAPFQDAFGWYNATTSSPDSSDLHVMLDCNSTAGATVTLDLCQEPAYLGGPVGFFLLTPQSHASAGCAAGNCCASLSRLGTGEGYAYYSEGGYDPDYAGANSFIHLLLYPSRILDHRTYFAWEDLYGSGGSGAFTQMVVAVDGLQAGSAGNACAAGPDAGALDAGPPDAAPAGVDAAIAPDAQASGDAEIPLDAAARDAAGPPDDAGAEPGPDAAPSSADASAPGRDAASAEVDAGPGASDAAGCSCGSAAGTSSLALLALGALAASASRRRRER